MRTYFARTHKVRCHKALGARQAPSRDAESSRNGYVQEPYTTWSAKRGGTRPEPNPNVATMDSVSTTARPAMGQYSLTLVTCRPTQWRDPAIPRRGPLTERRVSHVNCRLSAAMLFHTHVFSAKKIRSVRSMTGTLRSGRPRNPLLRRADERRRAGGSPAKPASAGTAS